MLGIIEIFYYRPFLINYCIGEKNAFSRFSYPGFYNHILQGALRNSGFNRCTELLEERELPYESIAVPYDRRSFSVVYRILRDMVPVIPIVSDTSYH
ncbi:MAG TPA: hypothetical protein PLM22_04955, partial [Candidatus Sabulitectum sp.]|nr:hypothetical protein [Candidatus Sabulitectum sp.]